MTAPSQCCQNHGAPHPPNNGRMTKKTNNLMMGSSTNHLVEEPPCPSPPKKNASLEATQEIVHNPEKDFESSQKPEKCGHTTHARTGVSKSDRGCIPLRGSIFPTALEAVAAREIEIEDTSTRKDHKTLGCWERRGEEWVEHYRRSDAGGVAERALRSPAYAAAVTAAEVARLQGAGGRETIHTAPAGRRWRDSKAP